MRAVFKRVGSTLQLYLHLTPKTAIEKNGPTKYGSAVACASHSCPHWLAGSSFIEDQKTCPITVTNSRPNCNRSSTRGRRPYLL